MTLQNYYNTGTISVSNGGTSVVGVGTSWVAFIAADDIFWCNGQTVRVLSVTDNSHITLADPWPGGDQTAAAYEIRLPPPSTDVTAGVRALVESLEAGGVVYALQSLPWTNGDILQYVSGAFTNVPLATIASELSFPTGGSATPAINFGGTTGFSAATSTGNLVASVNGNYVGAFHSSGFGVRSSGAAHDLVLASSEAITADRMLSFVLGDANRSVTLGGNVSTAADFSTSGAYALTLTQTGATNVTLPTTGTLSTLAGAETLTNKTINASNNTFSNLTTAMFAANVVDNDATMAADSSTRLPTQAAVVSYVQNYLNGLAWKAPVACVAPNNIALSGEQTLDGFTTSGSRVLVFNQTTASQNGIYISSSGAWTRSTDAATGPEIVNATTLVENGTLYKGTVWTNTNTAITLGTTSITFVQAGTLGSSVTAGTGLFFSGTALGIQSNGVTYALFQTMVANSLHGNPTGSTATSQAITLGAALTFSGTALQTVAMTGDVTTSANSFATTVAKIAGVSVGTPTGTGNVVFSSGPTLTNPIVGTQSTGDNSTKAASTAFVQTAVSPFTGGNKIINGDMQVDQRNAGASLTPTTDGQYTVDRWSARMSAASKFSVQQFNTTGTNVFAAFGLAGGLAITSLSAFSVGTSDYFAIEQPIEANNLQDTAYGRPTAQSLTVSFAIQSSVTGTYGAVLYNNNAMYGYPFSFALTANTPTIVSVTIPGDTAHSISTGNTAGLSLRISLGAGSSKAGSTSSWQSGNFFGVTGQTSLVATNGATMYLSAVKVELGSIRTTFVADDYSVSLRKCQRYFEYIYLPQGYSILCGQAVSTTRVEAGIVFSVTKRAAPTMTVSGAGILQFTTATNSAWGSGTLSLGTSSTDHASVFMTGSSLLVAGNASQLFASTGSNTIAFSAEL